MGEYRQTEQILNYLSENKEWLFSGAGLLIFSAIGLIIKTIHSRKEKKHANKNNVTIKYKSFIWHSNWDSKQLLQKG